MATLQEKTQALFNGYPNSSRQTVQEFLDYIFGQTSDPTFATLTVTGSTHLMGTVVCDANVTIGAGGAFRAMGTGRVDGAVIFNSTLNVAGAITAIGNVTVAGALEVTQASQFFGSLGVTGTFQVDAAATFNGSVQCNTTLSTQSEIVAASTVASGVIIQLGADADMNISVTDLTAGKELYLLNQNTGGKVLVGAGSGDGTGSTLIGNTADKIGFYNQGISAVRGSVTTADPVDLPTALVQIIELKTALLNVNLVRNV